MRKRLSPPKVLALGFLGVIFAGTVLLYLPFASRDCSLVDALFTATSAVCVTGLIVKDTPHDFTMFGQVVIMLLIQIGGLGYMTFATIIPILMGRKLGLGDRLLLKEGLNLQTVEGIVRFTKAVFKVTLAFELAGAALLTLRFAREMEGPRAAFFGLFHAVSAFNNAGFSLFSTSLMDFRASITVNFVICTLILFGGIGFGVIIELHEYAKRKVGRLSQHTKIVLAATALLLAGGTLLFFVFEYMEAGGALKGYTLSERILSSVFSSVTARTAGFNTIDFSLVRVETLFMVAVLMFIGASPGSTGGGIKTTSFYIIISSLWTLVRGRTDVVAFHRRISEETILRSYALASLAALLVISVSLLLIFLEGRSWPESVFETVSAFATVGLSVGDGGTRSLSAAFSPAGKLLMTVTMYAGRLGPLTLAIAMLESERLRYRYPEGKVMIG